MHEIYSFLWLASRIVNPFRHPSQVHTQVLVLQTCVDLRVCLARALVCNCSLMTCCTTQITAQSTLSLLKDLLLHQPSLLSPKYCDLLPLLNHTVSISAALLHCWWSSFEIISLFFDVASCDAESLLTLFSVSVQEPSRRRQKKRWLMVWCTL